MPRNKKQHAEMENWISSLAKEQASTEAAAIPSKEERMRKRAAKKAKRQQQIEAKRPAIGQQPKRQSQQKRQVSLTKVRMRQLKAVLESIRDVHKQKDYEAFQAPPLKKRKTKGWNEDTIQPRRSDYSGIGLARESLFISFKDPSFSPSLEEEFKEHIPGFFGKQRTKAMKKQYDANMLWRQLADKKKLNKTLKGMTPDQRVEAMIDSGMI